MAQKVSRGLPRRATLEGVDTPTRGWKSDEDRGPVGAWFVRAIGDRSIEQVATDMAERGHAHKPDYYRGIMSGAKKPGRALLAALEEYLGSSPDTPSQPADLASAIRELVEELRAARQERATMAAHIAELESIVRALVEPAIADGSTPHVQQETTG